MEIVPVYHAVIVVLPVAQFHMEFHVRTQIPVKLRRDMGLFIGVFRQQFSLDIFRQVKVNPGSENRIQFFSLECDPVCNDIVRSGRPAFLEIAHLSVHVHEPDALHFENAYFRIQGRNVHDYPEFGQQPGKPQGKSASFFYQSLFNKSGHRHCPGGIDCLHCRSDLPSKRFHSVPCGNIRASRQIAAVGNSVDRIFLAGDNFQHNLPAGIFRVAEVCQSVLLVVKKNIQVGDRCLIDFRSRLVYGPLFQEES